MDELILYIKKFDIKAIMINSTNNNILKIIRYLFVGGIATIVDWGVTFGFTETGTNYKVSTTLGFIFGLVVNYTLSKLIVFSASKAKVNSIVEFLLYALIGISGLGITLLLMHIGVEILKLWYMGVRVFATLMTLFWNYFARSLLYNKNK